MAKLSTCIFALLAGNIIAGPVELFGGQLAKRQIPSPVPSMGTQMSDLDWAAYLKDLSNKKLLPRFMGEAQAFDAFMGFARAMGANATSAGTIGNYLRNSVNKGWGLLKDRSYRVDGIVPQIKRTRSDLQPKAVKIRYGPYFVPNITTSNERGEFGMLVDWPDEHIEKPCDKCTIIAMEAGLEYESGINANIDTGMWLHHMVQFNIGPGRQEETCAHLDISVPHACIGATPRNSERFFASGNERTTVNFQKLGYDDVGYKIKSTDRFAVLLELMNTNKEDKSVYLTIEYNYVDGHPFKDDVKPLWFDARNCGTSDYNPPAGQDEFLIDWSWKPTVSGEIMGIWGHLHDGGDHLAIEVDGKKICDNIAHYGTTPGYIESQTSPSDTTGLGHAHVGAKKHLSQINDCLRPDLPYKQMSPGQTWKQTGFYNFEKNPGMKVDFAGKRVWDEVMAISLLYLRQPGKES